MQCNVMGNHELFYQSISILSMRRKNKEIYVRKSGSETRNRDAVFGRRCGDGYETLLLLLPFLFRSFCACCCRPSLSSTNEVLSHLRLTHTKKKKKKKKKKGPLLFLLSFSFLAENELHNVRLFSSMCTYRDSVVFTPYTYAFARNRDFQICQ